jgi:hypothetical protein
VTESTTAPQGSETFHAMTESLERHSSGRRRRLPSYLLADYGTYGDDQPTHHQPFSPRTSLAPIQKTKKRKSSPTVMVQQSEAVTFPPPTVNESLSHLSREVRELRRTSNGFFDMNLSRHQRRESLRQQQTQRSAAISTSGAHLDLCPASLGDTRWELSKKRVYQFKGVTPTTLPSDSNSPPETLDHTSN